jgi:polyphenol oxidase
MNDWITPDWPAPARVRALITTRSGGTSVAPYGSLNLGDHVGDDALQVAQNRALLRAHLPAEPKWLKQVHGVAVADACTIGAEADASVAYQAHEVCVVLTADCLPILLCDQSGTVVGAAHAGWRGLLNGVIEATVAAMHVPPPSLLAYLGPAIGPQAFEVGDEVRQAFVSLQPEAADAFVVGTADTETPKWFADIYQLARLSLHKLGVARVFGGDLCTFSDAERFYSYRRDGATGRMASLIWME